MKIQNRPFRPAQPGMFVLGGAMLLGAVSVHAEIVEKCSGVLGFPINDSQDPENTINIGDGELPGGTISDLQVKLDIEHDLIGDLVVTLAGPETVSDPVTLIHRPGLNDAGVGSSCGPVEISVTIDDEAGTAAEDMCDLEFDGKIEGHIFGVDPLTVLYLPDGDGAGDWVLTVTDVKYFDDGTLNEWGLSFVVGEPNEPPDCSNAAPSKSHLWPINRKTKGTFKEIDIVGVTDPENDPISINIDSICQDEEVGEDADGSGVTGSFARLRVEKDDPDLGNGRLYHIGFTATDEVGKGTCSGTVAVRVPHRKRDLRKIEDNDPVSWDSTLEHPETCPPPHAP